MPDDAITLRSGRTVYANRGIFGLEENNGEFRLTDGYDRYADWPAPDWINPEDAMTVDDVREIADMMIDRWTRFRAAL